MSPLEAAKDLAGTSPYDEWGKGERLVVNLTALVPRPPPSHHRPTS